MFENEAKELIRSKTMTEEQIKIEMDKALHEVFNTDEIVKFQFDLVQKAFLKGLELGMKIGKELKK